MQPSDDSLVTRACRGESTALVELFRRNESGIRAAIQARLPDRWRALLSVDDVLQQTYVEAILAIRRFEPRGEGAFATWIRKLAEHHVIEAVRALEADKRGGRSRRVESPASADSYATLLDCLTGLATRTTPSVGAARAEVREMVSRALARLPEHYRLVVQRYDLEGRSIDEVAAESGRSPGAVHLIRVRAHARMRELLDGQVTVFSSLA
jgi:RNA polymerase sigma factor (sigma-70 family)